MYRFPSYINGCGAESNNAPPCKISPVTMEQEMSCLSVTLAARILFCTIILLQIVKQHFEIPAAYFQAWINKGIRKTFHLKPVFTFEI
jgi:hypothetical protein